MYLYVLCTSNLDYANINNRNDYNNYNSIIIRFAKTSESQTRVRGRFYGGSQKKSRLTYFYPFFFHYSFAYNFFCTIACNFIPFKANSQFSNHSLLYKFKIIIDFYQYQFIFVKKKNKPN